MGKKGAELLLKLLRGEPVEIRNIMESRSTATGVHSAGGEAVETVDEAGKRKETEADGAAGAKEEEDSKKVIKKQWGNFGKNSYLPNRIRCFIMTQNNE